MKTILGNSEVEAVLVDYKETNVAYEEGQTQYSTVRMEPGQSSQFDHTSILRIRSLNEEPSPFPQEAEAALAD